MPESIKIITVSLLLLLCPLILPYATAKPNKVVDPETYKNTLNSLVLINARDAKVELVIDGLESPWAMEFISDSELLINESIGKLKRVDLINKTITEVSGLPKIAKNKGQLGLMDIEIHPQFSSNGWIYLSYSAEDPEKKGQYTTALSRAKLQNNSLENVHEIFRALPYAITLANFGGAIEFDDKNYVYFAAGDRGRNIRSQKLNKYNGKIIRLHDDGSIPKDNPYIGQDNILPGIWAHGVRNPQGLVFDRSSQKLYEVEHGPMGGDEINIIKKGGNYGSPVIGYGQTYGGKKIGEGTYKEGLEQPLYYYLPSIAPSPIEVYRGDMFPEWQGNLLIGALKAQHVNMLDIVDGVVISEQRILNELKERIRDIKVGPQGAIYILGQSGKLYKLSR